MKREGLSTQVVSKLTQVDRRTVRKHPGALETTPAYGPRSPAPGKLYPHKAYLIVRVESGVWNVQVLLGEIR